MKNLKKLMSVVLSVVMLMSFVVSTSAATFTDVAETDKAYEAVEVLAALKILEGKEAGAFDPEANIKRSEFAAVICRAMNQESAAIGAANFTDVSADHWAAGYIGWAAAQGIVNGRGDGSFDPDANVSYNEAIAMIVRAMGYEWYVEEMLGGYPTGYARIAGSYKIDKDITSANGNAPATRADVATLVYNAFDAPLMDMSYTISADAEYVIYNGSKNVDYEKRTMLSYYRDVYKVRATVEKTFKNDNKYIDNKGNMLMDLSVSNVYGFDGDEGRYLEVALGENFRPGGKKIASDNVEKLTKVVANSDVWAGYQGYTVNAYIMLNDDNKLEVVAMVPDARVSDELVIENARELVEVSEKKDGKYYFEYLEDADANRATEVDMADAITVYYNDKEVTSGADAKFANIAKGDYASVTLLDSNGDGYYDKVYLTNYVYGIVEEVNADLEIITTTAGRSYRLGENSTSETFVYTIYKDGAEIGLEDLAAGDMLNIVIGDEKNNIKDATFADIYVTNNVIESSVSSKSGDRYVIDGEDYYLASNNMVDELAPGDAGSFYITIDGYIYDADFTSTYSDNYAFILNIASVDSGWGQSWEIKLIDKNNSVMTLPVKSTVYVTDASDKREPLKDSDGTQDTYFEKLAAKVHVKDADAANHNIRDRFVTFKESDGEISELVFAKDAASAKDREFAYKNIKASAENYNAKTGLLAGFEIADSTVIFNVPVSGAEATVADKTKGYGDGYYLLNEDRIQVYSMDNLSEEETYSGFAYNVDKNEVPGALVLTHDPGFAGHVNSLAVVRSISTGLNAAGDVTDVVTFWQGTEAASLAVAKEGFIGTNLFDADKITVGDVFQYTVNADGEINGVDLIYDIDTTTLVVDTAKNPKITYSLGLVTNNTDRRVTISNADETDVALPWGDLETCVLVNAKRLATTSKTAIAGYEDPYFLTKLDTEEVDEKEIFGSDAYVVVVRSYDNEVVDVVAYEYDMSEEDVVVDDFVATLIVK